ncbi:unnamed protein product [Protopolystoma xenopodis]|uniref:Uncharacterized protein n=1 Tax=Protopolystoma xenopodis TaxID=117903 RepID=A0A448WSK4_9PLAT|nr:unnamed protein product [Protopolystoma xenopodis]
MNVFLLNRMDLGNQLVLPNSADHDIVTSSCVGDLNCDGITELVLGTFDQSLLIYRLVINFFVMVLPLTS